MDNRLRLGIAGLGVVGTGVLDILARHGKEIAARGVADLELAAISARTRSRQRGDHDVERFQWFDDARELAASPDIDVFVELIGGEDGIARQAVETALGAGKHVVTANKALLARHGTALARLAEANQVALNFEAAVAAGIPIVKTVRESLSGNAIKQVFGILNGTCNYILTVMTEHGSDFSQALADAQRLGYAEADPTFDIGGFDAAHKLACLTSLAFGTEVEMDSIFVEGIQQITTQDIQNAERLGYKIKLLAVSKRTDDGIEQRVHPALVPLSSPIADVSGVFNAVAVKGDFVGNLMLEGPGAGAHPTASSVIGDLCDIARGRVLDPFGIPASKLKPYKRAPMRAHEGGYYIAMLLHDRPGEVATVARILADQGISIDSIEQRQETSGAGPDAAALFVVITHDTLESAVRAALERIEAEGHTAAPARMIRIERF